jgi:hypothetical protein
MPSNGWLVALFHQVRVTLAAVLGLGLPALLAGALLVPAGVLVVDELPLLHAAAAVAVVTASATTASARLLRMCSPDRGIGAKTFRKFSEYFRRAVIVKTPEPPVNPSFPWRYRHFHNLTIAVRCCDNSPAWQIYVAEMFRE